MANNPETPQFNERTSKTIEALENVVELQQKSIDAKATLLTLLATFERKNLETESHFLSNAVFVDQVYINFIKPVFTKYARELKQNGGNFTPELQLALEKDTKEVFSIIEGILVSYTKGVKEFTPDTIAEALSGNVRINQIANYLNQDGSHYAEIFSAYLSGNEETDEGLTKSSALTELKNNLAKQYLAPNPTLSQNDFSVINAMIYMMDKTERTDLITNIYGEMFEKEGENANKKFANLLRDLNYRGTIGAAEMIYHIDNTQDLGLILEFEGDQEQFAKNWEMHDQVAKSVKNLSHQPGYGTYNGFYNVMQPKNVLAFLMYTQSTVTIAANVGVGIFNAKDKSVKDFLKNLPRRLVSSTLGNHNTLAAAAIFAGANAVKDLGEAQDVEFDDNKAEDRLYTMMNGGGSVWDGYDSHFKNEDGNGITAFSEFLHEKCVNDRKLVKKRITTADYQEFLLEKINDPNLNEEEKTRYQEDLSNFADNFDQSFIKPETFTKIGEMIFQLNLGTKQEYEEKKKKVLIG